VAYKKAENMRTTTIMLAAIILVLSWRQLHAAGQEYKETLADKAVRLRFASQIKLFENVKTELKEAKFSSAKRAVIFGPETLTPEKMVELSNAAIKDLKAWKWVGPIMKIDVNKGVKFALVGEIADPIQTIQFVGGDKYVLGRILYEQDGVTNRSPILAFKGFLFAGVGDGSLTKLTGTPVVFSGSIMVANRQFLMVEPLGHVSAKIAKRNKEKATKP